MIITGELAECFGEEFLSDLSNYEILSITNFIKLLSAKNNLEVEEYLSMLAGAVIDYKNVPVE